VTTTTGTATAGTTAAERPLQGMTSATEGHRLNSTVQVEKPARACLKKPIRTEQSHPPQSVLRSFVPLGPSLALEHLPLQLVIHATGTFGSSVSASAAYVLEYLLLAQHSCAFDHVFPCLAPARLPLARLTLADSCASDHVFPFPSLWLVFSPLSQHASRQGPHSS
jgi:hypothetical protein